MERLLYAPVQAAQMYPDLIGRAVVGAIILLLLISIHITGGRAQRLPIDTAYVVSWFLMFALPVLRRS